MANIANHLAHMFSYVISYEKRAEKKKKNIPPNKTIGVTLELG